MPSKRLKALILCNDFPPINSIGAERPNSWYKYFKEFNIHPIIVTKNWNGDGNNNFGHVHNKRTINKDEYGTIIRCADFKTTSLWFRSIFGSRFSLIRKIFTFLEQLLSFNFSFFDQHHGIYKEANNYLKSNNVDLIITTVAPFILFKYGYILKNKYNIPWVADYRDGWYLNHGISLRHNIFRKLELSKELKYTKRTDLIITVDPNLAARLESLIGKKVNVIYNGFWEFYSTKNQIKTDHNKLVLNHTGTLTDGQRIEILLDSLVRLKKENKISKNNLTLNLIGIEHFPDQIKRLEKYQVELEGIINTTPRLKQEKAIELNLKADYLINFTDPNISAIYAKTYNYIACKKPILVVPGDKGILDDLINKNKLGVILNSDLDIENFLVDRNIHFEPNIENLNFFTRKNQTKIFADLIHNSLFSS